MLPVHDWTFTSIAHCRPKPKTPDQEPLIAAVLHLLFLLAVLNWTFTGLAHKQQQASGEPGPVNPFTYFGNLPATMKVLILENSVIL